MGEVRERQGHDISLVLHDTSTDQDVNVNEMLLDRLTIPPLERPSSDYSSSTSSPRQLASPTAESDEQLLLSADLAKMKEIMPPAIPKKGDFFDINITLAASPSNFTVQSWADGTALEQQQAAMARCYRPGSKNAAAANKPVTKEDLAADVYFAAKHSDGQWYRVRVNSMLDECTVAVRFVDYGDFSMIALENLRILWAQFRNLPMQAINATLAGEFQNLIFREFDLKGEY